MATPWENALSDPLDQTLISGGKTKYDLTRPLYRCAVCMNEGEASMHKYIDECRFFVDAAEKPFLSNTPV